MDDLDELAEAEAVEWAAEGRVEAAVKAERERVLVRLQAFQTSCEGYMTKAVWRELDVLVVELGGEHKPYRFA